MNHVCGNPNGLQSPTHSSGIGELTTITPNTRMVAYGYSGIRMFLMYIFYMSLCRSSTWRSLSSRKN